MAGVVGAGAPGGAASRTPIPTIAAPATPVTYWRADVVEPRDLVLRCLGHGRNPLRSTACLPQAALLCPC